MMNTLSKILFLRAMQQLKSAKIMDGTWTLGGGTVLSEIYNHRTSKDIDIFINNPQLLTSISPRVNDAVENSLEDYQEMSNYVKLIFPEGKVDFIVAPKLCNVSTTECIIEGYKVYVDSPVEIISKKIFYRGESFKERDIIDLAVVYKNNGNLASEFAKIPGVISKVATLEYRICEMPQEKYDAAIENDKIFQILSGSDSVRGHEIELCKEFIAKVKEIAQMDNAIIKR